MKKDVPTTFAEVQNTYNPFVSVIVASYNYDKYIRQNLESMVNQTYENFEVLVIDDGSTDSSMEIIAEFQQSDSRVKLLTHESHANRGLSESVKLALSQARGTWIAFCESDDYWAPNHLEEKVACASKYSTADVIVCRPKIFGVQEIVDKYNLGVRTLFELLRGLKKPSHVYFPMLKTWDFPTFSVVMVRANALRTCNFSPPVKNGLDIWLWRQLTPIYRTMFVDRELTYWRRTVGESLIWAKESPPIWRTTCETSIG